MLSVLTKYLVQYGRVCIPHIGTFEIVQEAPQLDIADKVFKPPFYKTVFSDKDFIPEHQLQFIATGNEHPKRELLLFGENLKAMVHEAPVDLSGFGKLRYHANSIEFEPELIQPASLQAVPAQKVMRENVLHNVLVGDREVSRQATDDWGQSKRKRSLIMTIGWIVLGLAVAAIGTLLYLGKFQVTSTGLRLHP